MLTLQKLTRGAIITALLMLFMAGSVIAQSFAPVTITHTAVNVTTDSGEVLAANSERKWALVENDSDTDIYCKVNAVAVLNQGVRINKNGGSFEISVSLGNFNEDAINCRHGGTGNKVMLVMEGQ